jgi:epoxyqueuosine reductase QueG
MGEIGKNNLLLTPEFGPHQRLCAIITEAELEPDPRRDFDLCRGCNKCMEACPSGALTPDGYDLDPCFVYWAFGFKRLPPEKIWQWPGYIRMLRQHVKKRDFLVEFSQTYITDIDFCIECMRACPVGENWKKIRPKKLPFQKSGATELENRD